MNHLEIQSLLTLLTFLIIVIKVKTTITNDDRNVSNNSLTETNRIETNKTESSNGDSNSNKSGRGDGNANKKAQSKNVCKKS